MTCSNHKLVCQPLIYYVLIVLTWRCDKHWGLSKMDLLCRCEWQMLYWNVKNLNNFVQAGPTANMPALVHVMAWRWIGSVKSSVINSLLPRWQMHVIRPQCVNSLWPGDSTWHDSLGNIGLVNGLWTSRRLDITWTDVDLLTFRHLGTHFSEIEIKILIIGFRKCIWTSGLHIDRLLFRPKYAIVINSMSLERYSVKFRRTIL